MTLENEVVKEVVVVKQQIVNLSFDCYEFYKFIETISKYVDEAELIFENRDLTINFMDASRIMLAKCSMYLTNYHGCELLEKMTFGVNTSDFAKLLKTRKSDKKEVELIFDNTKKFIEITKTSQKYDSHINKTLNLLDLDLEEIPMDNLSKIEYPSKVHFQTSILDDFYYESSNYSEVVEIEIDEDIGISFSETGQIGNSKYLIKKEFCNDIKGFEKSSYSYTFLTPIKPLLPILASNSEIIFSIKQDHPIKLNLYIESLDINILIFLAPRVEERDYDDDYDENDF